MYFMNSSVMNKEKLTFFQNFKTNTQNAYNPSQTLTAILKF